MNHCYLLWLLRGADISPGGRLVCWEEPTHHIWRSLLSRRADRHSKSV